MTATVETPIETSTDGVRSSVETSTGPEAQGWRKDTKDRYYIPRQGKSGVIYRQGDETPDEARARDSKGPAKDRPPKSKRSKVPKAPAPSQKTIQEIEFALSELFKSPEMVTAMQGDEWATMHFDREAPVLARNLAHAAETNPWLRSKLEAIITGEGVFLFKILALAPLISAAIAYLVPPFIYYFDPKFIPAEARDRFNVPHRPSERTRELLREQRAAEREAEAQREQAEIDAIMREMQDAKAAPAAEAAGGPEAAAA